MLEIELESLLFSIEGYTHIYYCEFVKLLIFLSIDSGSGGIQHPPSDTRQRTTRQDVNCVLPKPILPYPFTYRKVCLGTDEPRHSVVLSEVIRPSP